MGDANWWETVANDFLNHYYSQFDAGVEARVGLAALYQAESMLTYYGEPLLGPEAIAEKLQNLKFRSVSHQPQAITSQPSPNGGVFVQVCGLLQADEDAPLHFAQSFQLLPAGESYYVYNDIFNLLLDA